MTGPTGAGDGQARAEERRSARRAALRATHPDLGGDVEEFLAVVRAFEASADVAPTEGARAPAPTVRPTVTTTRRSRAARRARRARRRLRTSTARRLPWPARHYAHLPEERS